MPPFELHVLISRQVGAGRLVSRVTRRLSTESVPVLITCMFFFERRSCLILASESGIFPLVLRWWLLFLALQNSSVLSTRSGPSLKPLVFSALKTHQQVLPLKHAVHFSKKKTAVHLKKYINL